MKRTSSRTAASSSTSQHGLVAGQRRQGLDGGATGGDVVGDGEQEAEGGAAAGLAGHLDVAVALGDDAVHRREAEAGALARLLGGEERLEGARPRRLVHAAAGVGDLEHEVVAGGGGDEDAAVVLVQLDVGGPDGERAALGHGVAGVDGEVEQHLPELARIGAQLAELRIEEQAQLDVLADHAAEQLGDVLDDAVEVQDLGLEDALAAEGEELAGEQAARSPAAAICPSISCSGLCAGRRPCKTSL